MHIVSDGIAFGLCVYSFIDKDTKQHISYSPALEISGYGDTYEKSIDMMRFSISEFLQHFKYLPPKETEKELLELGWKKSWFKNRDFSKSYVDISGQLQNFNADEGSVKRHLLQVA